MRRILAVLGVVEVLSGFGAWALLDAPWAPALLVMAAGFTAWVECTTWEQVWFSEES